MANVYSLLLYAAKLLLAPLIGVAGLTGSAAAQSLADYRWQHRLVVVAEDKNKHLFKEVVSFSRDNDCAFKERDLKIIHAKAGTPIWDELLKRSSQTDGLFLIGYDGGIKDQSQDLSLLGRLNETIDKMPMRRQELASRNGRSSC